MASPLQPDLLTGDLRLTAYGPGFIVLNGVRWTTPLLIQPDQPPAAWSVASPELITQEDLAALRQHGPELVLLGTGDRQIFLPARVLSGLTSVGPNGAAPVGCEAMTTAAACRTFNLLVAEGRRLSAVLYPPSPEPDSRTTHSSTLPPH